MCAAENLKMSNAVLIPLHICPLCFSNIVSIIVVYDITNEKSFENIVKWLRNIDEVNITKIPRIIKKYHGFFFCSTLTKT